MTHILTRPDSEQGNVYIPAGFKTVSTRQPLPHSWLLTQKEGLKSTPVQLVPWSGCSQLLN